MQLLRCFVTPCAVQAICTRVLVCCMLYAVCVCCVCSIDVGSESMRVHAYTNVYKHKRTVDNDKRASTQAPPTTMMAHGFKREFWIYISGSALSCNSQHPDIVMS